MSNTVGPLGNSGIPDYGSSNNKRILKPDVEPSLLPDDVKDGFNGRTSAEALSTNNTQLYGTCQSNKRYTWTDSKGSFHSVGADAMSFSDWCSYIGAKLTGRA